MLGRIVTALVAASAASAHIVLTYPGTRGNGLITNDSHPYGMQWEYPCACPLEPLLSFVQRGRYEMREYETRDREMRDRERGDTE